METLSVYIPMDRRRAMEQFAAVATPSGRTVTLAMKAAVATGPVRRFLVGNPDVQVIDVLAGTTLENLAAAEHLAARGEVVLDPATVAALDGALRVAAWRDGAEDGRRFAVVEGLVGLAGEVAAAPGPAAPGDGPGSLTDEQVRPWLLPAVYERLRGGQGEFLAELRPAVALFLQFGGSDYEGDPEAGAKL